MPPVLIRWRNSLEQSGVRADPEDLVTRADEASSAVIDQECGVGPEREPDDAVHPLLEGLYGANATRAERLVEHSSVQFDHVLHVDVERRRPCRVRWPTAAS